VKSDEQTTGYDRANVRAAAGMQALGFLGCCCGGAGDFFFKTRWLLVYSNIRPARSQHTHALRLTSRWAPPVPLLLPRSLLPRITVLLFPSRYGFLDGWLLWPLHRSW
jgi:hypothetical protein